jgi:hypothetical protein
MSNEVDMYDDVKKKVAALLEKPHPQLWVEIKENEVLLRVQPTRYDDNPVFYNPDSDSRYADGSGNTAVLYLASSAELAIAETIQQGSSGPGTPVMRSEVEERSLHYLKVARPLRMVDAGMVISCLVARDTHSHRLSVLPVVSMTANLSMAWSIALAFMTQRVRRMLVVIWCCLRGVVCK